MADIRPFRALRFSEQAGAIEELTCPPYDIISEEQRQQYLARNPHNIIRLELPRDGSDPYAEAGSILREWMETGILHRDEQPAFYIYDIEFTIDTLAGAVESKHITGLMAQVKLEEFEKGIVLPHEYTLSKAKTDRLNLMQSTACNFSSIYSLYMDDASAKLDIEALTKGEPLLCITDEAGLIHRVWAIDDEAQTNAIQQHFAAKKLYIADGHHRYETALNYRNGLRAEGIPNASSDYVMMMLVEMNHPGLVVFPTHRLVHHLAQFDADTVLKACEPYFDIHRDVPVSQLGELLQDAYAHGQHAFGFYTGDETLAVLNLRDLSVMDALLPDVSPASRALDVTVLHTLVLERLMGIDKENMANQTNLTYTRDLTEALNSVKKGESQCAFLLNPTRVAEIRDVASAGEKMPQKSTYFYPKLITGHVMNRLAD